MVRASLSLSLSQKKTPLDGLGIHDEQSEVFLRDEGDVDLDRVG